MKFQPTLSDIQTLSDYSQNDAVRLQGSCQDISRRSISPFRKPVQSKLPTAQVRILHIPRILLFKKARYLDFLKVATLETDVATFNYYYIIKLLHHAPSQ